MGRVREALAHAFAVDTKEPLTEEDRALLEKIADGIVRRGLGLPLRMLIESSLPLRGVGGQALYCISPYLESTTGTDVLRRLGEVLERKHGLEVLARMIEERDG